MAHILAQYSLTQYSDFRKLQFEYIKVKDENEQLKIKIGQIEQLYQSVARQLLEIKRVNTKVETERLNNLKVQIHQKSVINNEIEQMLELMKSMKEDNQIKNNSNYKQNSKYKDNDRNHAQNQTTTINSIKYLSEQIRVFSQQYNKMQRTISQIIQQCKDKQKSWIERQQKFSQQIVQLQLDLQSLQKMIAELQQQNQKIIRDNQSLHAQIKSYKSIAIQARNQRSPIKKQIQKQLQKQFNEDDKNFANQLLCYEKQMLFRVFGLIIESFEGNDKQLQYCLKRIFQAYQDVIECFRQKLQIQYDLEDLQYQYQKQKISHTKTNVANKQILIELKKQISKFRAQLFNQKQILHEKQEMLHSKINDLSGQAINDNRLKSFTINLHNKLRQKSKGYTQTQNNEYKIERNQKYMDKQKQKCKEDSQDNNQNEFGKNSKYKNLSIQFRPTLSTDEMMKKMIEKDRQNLQRMLKETRKQFRK